MSNTLDVNDPLIDALIMQESSGDPNAVSSAGAKGLTQLLDSTFADYAKPGQDIFDPDVNREVGTKHLNRLLDKYEGNTELALTAYNWGEGNLDKAIRKTGSTDLDELEQVIPRGAQPGYARQVLSKLQEGETPNVPKQSRRNSKVSTFNSSPLQEDEEEIATPKYTLGQTDRNDRKGLYEVLAPAMLGGGPYNSLSLEEQLNLLNEVAISKPWDEDTKQAIKDFGSIAYEYAPIDQQFKFEDLVGTPPITPPDADPVKATQQWAAQVVSDLRRDGVSPLIYGKYLDDYLEQASQAEIQAHEIRNRGMVGEATNWLSGAASSLMKGALQNISEPAAGITRLATGGSEQGQATADWIESLPNNLVYTPDLDYLYETDENGKLYIAPQTGAPVTKASAFWLEGIGEVAGALVGGIGFKGVGLAAKGAGKVATGQFIDKAVGIGLVTTDALAAGNESFKIVYDATGGDLGSAYTSALWSMGTSALTEGVTDMAIVSKIGSPGAAALSNYNKGVYVGKHVLQSATLGATGNAAADALAQAGEMAVAGTEFSAERLGYQAAFGAIGGGVAGAVTGVIGARRQEPQVAPPPPPEVEGPITDTGVPPQQAPRAPLGLPLPERIDVRGPEVTETVPYAPTTPEEQITATQLAEGFQNSWEPVGTMSIEQARNLDPAVRETLGIRILPSGESNGIVVVEKENSYGEVTPADTVEGIDQQIQKIQKDLQDNPSKEELGSGKVGDDLRVLKIELKALIEQRAEANETQAARQAQAVDIFNRREAAIKRLEALQQERRINKDPDIRIILGEDIRAARQDVDAIDAEWLALDNEEQRIAELTTKIKDIQNKITAATTPGVRGKSLYANNRSLQNGNLAKLFDERKKRIVAQNDPNLQSVYNGFEIGGFRVMPYNGKWYAFNPVTEETSRGFADYKDLLETIDARSRGETVSKQFVTRVDTEPKPVRAERPTAKVEVKAEPKKRGRPRKTEVRREVPPMPEGDTGVDLNDVLLTTGGAERRGEAEPRVEEARERVQEVRPDRGVSTLTPRESYKKANYTDKVQFDLTGSDPVTYRDIFNRAANIVRALNKGFTALTNTRLPRGVLGLYNGLKTYASVGKIDDVSTFMHEAIGHAIDATIITKWNTLQNDYKDIDEKTYEGLVETAQDYYPTPIKEPQTLIREGFAIFFQNYMTGQPVHKDVLNWYQNTFKEKHPEVFKELESLKELTFKYLNASPAVHALNNRVGDKVAQVPKKTFKQWYTIIKDNWVSESAVLKELDAVMGSNLKALRNTNTARAITLADNLVNKGLVDLNNNQLIGMSLKEAIEPAKGATEQLMLYLYFNNSLTMNKEGKDSGMSTPDLERGLADFREKASEANPNVKERLQYQGAMMAANNLYKVNTQFLLMLRNTSPDARVYVDKLIKKNLDLTGTVHGYYAPRQVVGKGKFDTSKKRTGTSRAVKNPINLYRDAYQQRYEAALMSQEKQALIESASVANGSKTSTYIREIKGKNTPLLKVYKDKLKELLNREPTTEDMLDAPFILPGFEAPAYQQVENNAIMVYHDGETMRFFEVDPRLTKAYGAPLPQVLQSPALKAVRLSTQVLKQGATTFNPIFQLWELIRTPATVARYLDSDSYFGTAKNLLNVYYNMLYTVPDVVNYNLFRGETGLAAALGRMGVLTSVREASTRNLDTTLTDNVLSNTLEGMLNGLSKAASAFSVVEQSSRLAAVRIVAKERGITDVNAPLSVADQVALANAYRVSGTNFLDQGRTARIASQFVPFLSARIAEVSRIPGDFARNPKSVGAYFIAASLYGFYHAVANSDDEDMREMNYVERFKFINLPTTINGVKSYLKIPMDTVTQLAFSLGTVFGLKATEKEDMPVALKDLAATFAGEYAPVGSVEQALLAPIGPLGVAIGQQIFNKNFYFDKAIVPETLKYLPAQEQYTEYTSELAKKVGSISGLSPLRIEQAIRDVFPAAIKYIRAGESLTGIKETSKEDRDGNFMLSALVRAGSSSNIADQSRTAFENNLEKYQATKDSGDAKEDAIRKYLERVRKDITDLNVIIRGTSDQEVKDQLRLKRRELYRKGAAVNENNFVVTPTGQYAYRAKIMREQEKAKRRKN